MSAVLEITHRCGGCGTAPSRRRDPQRPLESAESPETNGRAEPRRDGPGCRLDETDRAGGSCESAQVASFTEASLSDLGRRFERPRSQRRVGAGPRTPLGCCG
ncbi:hypothetical protein M885DRAFT_518014 [Pelagophyceae sp. CCMP2097]|nr:hypothetical protein M885DRAFT_518014 [Pelagophyceae sp. CCMP2097]